MRQDTYDNIPLARACQAPTFSAGIGMTNDRLPSWLAGHSGRIARTMAHGVNDDLFARDFVENQTERDRAQY
jgi:hypothetical protein